MATSIQIVFDATDPALLADFWALALGYTVQPPPDGFASWDEWAASMGIPEENWNDAARSWTPRALALIFFQRVPEGRTARTASILMSTPAAAMTSPLMIAG